MGSARRCRSSLGVCTRPAYEYAESLNTSTVSGTAQFSEVQVSSALQDGVINLVVRAREYASGGSGDGYIGQLNGYESAWKIIRVDNDVETVLALGPLSYANNDTFYFEASGSSLRLKKNAATLGTATSTTYTTGEAGFGLYGSGSLTVDNWRGGAVSVADTQPPSAPAGLSATSVGSNQISLTWSASSDNVGVTGYVIERCQSSACSNFAQVATATSTTYKDAALTAGTSYVYRVRARDAASNSSGYSSAVNAVTQPAGGVQVSDNFNRADGSLGANWTVNPLGRPLKIIGSRVQAPANDYAESLHTAAALGSAQFVEVQNAAGLSAGIINLVVRAREYTAGGSGDGYVAQLNGFDSAWRIIRVDNDIETVLASGSLTHSNNDTFYFEANGSTLTLKKNSVTIGTATSSTYSSGEVGLGLYSTGGLLVDNWRGGDLTGADMQAPGAPATLTATPASSNQVNLTWSAAADNIGVTAYLLERCQGATCTNFAQIVANAATSYTDTGLAGATTYRYRVRARDAANNASGYSAIANAVTPAAGSVTVPTVSIALMAVSPATGLRTGLARPCNS